MIFRPAPPLIALTVLAALAGCKARPDTGPVSVSVIGAETKLRDPTRAALRPADAALLGATAQGLVRFDEHGDIQPGLAIRWAISDDGLYYTFRLDRDLADAETVAATLRRLLQRNRNGPLRAKLEAVREIVAVTPEVIELRLSAPRPDLMTLLADPHATLLLRGRGTGPLLRDGEVRRLTRLHTQVTASAEGETPEKPRMMLLRGERVALAIARFQQGQADVVLGGGFDDLPFVRLAQVAPTALQIDPVVGLFGFRIAGANPFLMQVENRQALSMALDRVAIGQVLAGQGLGGSGWRSAQAILPPGLSDLPQPTSPFWARALANVRGGTTQAQASAKAIAHATIARWSARRGKSGGAGAGPVQLRLAMPEGVGSAILFGEIRRQWAAIGVVTVRVGPRAPADLRLIDEIAPSDQADWFLAHFLCDQGPPCSGEADAAFDQAMATLDSAARGRLIADAERKLAEVAPFIPIAQPFRWSLAAPDRTGFATNPRGAHPLAALVGK